MTKKELLEKIQALGPISDQQRNEIVCSLIGHSLIVTQCFGYVNCARCGAQVGDKLISGYSNAPKAVFVGHSCSTCQENYKKLTWQDKIFCPDPFKKEVAQS